jgi:transcriptional regulator GlxA family with amidase domain
MDPRIREAIALMEKQLHIEVSLDDLALSVNLSASRFRHLFKSETSVSPMQYLASLRMLKAKELIETSFLSVKQVRSSIGVHDKKHFSSLFKKNYGLTPAEYRSRHLRGGFLAAGAYAQTGAAIFTPG